MEISDKMKLEIMQEDLKALARQAEGLHYLLRSGMIPQPEHITINNVFLKVTELLFYVDAKAKVIQDVSQFFEKWSDDLKEIIERMPEDERE